jgi:hypothetical protein
MMRIRFATILFLFVFSGLSVFSSSILAIEDEDERYATIDTQREEAEAVKYIIPTILKKKYGKLKLDASASTVTGYDANVNLNRYDEDGSFFSQNTLSLAAKYPIIDDKLFVKGGYDFTWIKYFKFSDPDLIDNILSAGLESRLWDNLLWTVDYEADFVGFPRDKISRYTMNLVGTDVKHEINDWLYHKIRYEFFHKHYPDWKTLNSRGVLLQRDRGDTRNTIIHQIGIFIGDTTFIRFDNRFYRNNSNELFLKFYDYNAFKTKTAVTHVFTNKIYGSTSFAYQYKAYDKRSVGAQEFDQRDHLFIYGASLFYDIIPSISLGISVDLRENRSNENQQKYEDYIISSGVYAVF